MEDPCNKQHHHHQQQRQRQNCLSISPNTSRHQNFSPKQMDFFRQKVTERRQAPEALGVWGLVSSWLSCVFVSFVWVVTVLLKSHFGWSLYCFLVPFGGLVWMVFKSDFGGGFRAGCPLDSLWGIFLTVFCQVTSLLSTVLWMMKKFRFSKLFLVLF